VFKVSGIRKVGLTFLWAERADAARQKEPMRFPGRASGGG